MLINGDLQREQDKERDDFLDCSAVLKDKIRQVDKEYATMKAVYETQLATVLRRGESLDRRINVLEMDRTAMFDDEAVASAELIESRVPDLRRNISIMKGAVLATENDIGELRELVVSLPSDHSDIIDITKRQIKRRIDDEVFEVETEAADIEESVNELESEIRLSNVVSSGLREENARMEDRLKKLGAYHQALTRERESFAEVLRETAQQMPMASVDERIRAGEVKLKKKLQSIEAGFRRQFDAVEDEIERVTQEHESARNAIEAMNVKVQELTVRALEATSKGNHEVSAVKRRNMTEIRDIEERFRGQLEATIRAQRRSFLENRS